MGRDTRGRYVAKISVSELPEILRRISKGETVASIAKEYGIAQASLSYRFIRNMPEAYRAARIMQIEAKLRIYEQAYWSSDPDIHARARKVLKQTRYHAARHFPDVFPALWKERATIGRQRAFRGIKVALR